MVVVRLVLLLTGDDYVFLFLLPYLRVYFTAPGARECSFGLDPIKTFRVR